MDEMKERYCMYGRHFKPVEGFITIRHEASGTQRGMCTTCQEVRKKPRAELEALAARDKLERKRR